MACRILVAAGLLCMQASADTTASMEQELQSFSKDHDFHSQSKSSGDYQQYMSQYSGGSHGGDYKQYMSKYAGNNANYEQYIDKYAHQQGGSQSGNYQQYMRKYAGGQGGDYQQYMKKYAGGQHGDYQQYMKKYAGKQGGDYQQYMKKYTGGSQASDSVELMEKPGKKSSDSSELNLASAQATGTSHSGADYQQYMNQYAGGSGGNNYMRQYAGKYAGQYANEYQKYADYQEYMKRYQNEHNDIGSAHDAKNKGQLDKWYAGANQALQWYVPTSYSKYAHHDIDKQYEARLAELENPDSTTTGGPFVETALNLDELPKKVEQQKTQTEKSTKTFLAKSAEAANLSKKQTEEFIKQVENAKTQVDANLQLLADQVRADPGTCAGMGLLGVAFAFVVFFGMRRRRSIQTPVIMLG